jgi:hypothetical protein
MMAEYTAAGYLPNGLNFVADGDLDAIAAKSDCLGVNDYTRPSRVVKRRRTICHNRKDFIFQPIGGAS